MPAPDDAPVTPTRPLLPLTPAHSGGRQAITCRYRCGNQCFHEPPNTSENEYFRDVVRASLSRRGVLSAGAALTLAGAGALGGLSGAGAAAAKTTGGSEVETVADSKRMVPGTNFQPVAPNKTDAVVVPAGYQQSVVVRWGDPILPGAPAFDFNKQTAAAQEKQFGYNNDFCALVPHPNKLKDNWLMGSNHEYTTEKFLFKGYNEKAPTREQVEIAWAAHGFSVVAVRRDHLGRVGAYVDPTYNRRITAKTPFQITGPAAGSKLLKTKADPAGTKVFGTFANCAGGLTPWGTYLSGEENFHYYFANSDKITDPKEQERAKRYGLGTGTSERQWEKYDERFDLAKNPNEANRFGWIVEIDPNDPKSAPIKHTALGRFKHEGCTIHVTKNKQIVAYMGDDEKFEYIYKFVSSGKMQEGDSQEARENNKKLLDAGTLYVAKFNGDSAGEIDGTGKLPKDGQFDGNGIWIKLATTTQSFVPGMTPAEVFVFTRLAADKAGATKMDRPEDVEASPQTGKVYAALTNNDARGTSGKAPADEVNPRNTNKSGQVLELIEDRGNHLGISFKWNLLLVCGDPKAADTYYGGFDKAKVSPISCPDNVAFDPHGNLWLSTDGNALGSNDGLFAVPVEGAERGFVKQFLTVPIGGETCGPVIEDRFVLVSVQHPGELDDASADKPGSHWPDKGTSNPRASVVVVWQANKPIGV